MGMQRSVISKRVCLFRQMLDLGVEVNSHPVCFLYAEVFSSFRKCEGR
jgi:hypothetical protein